MEPAALRVPGLARGGNRFRGAEPWRVVADLIGTALILLIVVMFAMRNTAGQWDLRTYLAAGQVAHRGLDPYLSDHLHTVSGRGQFPFLYPPVTLLAFVPLSGLPLPLAKTLWMGMNVALLVGLIAWWSRWLGSGTVLLPIALAAVFGWNSSALSALRAGNVALIEAALIWAALVCYARDRRAAFASLIVAAACFKLKPAVLLLLMLVPSARHGSSPRTLLVAFVALGALVAAPLVAGPASHWQSFFRSVSPADGLVNPSALSLAAVLAQACGVPQTRAALAGVAGWSVIVAGLAAVGLPFLRAVFRARDPRGAAMAALFLYLIVDPRPMAYGFVLMTPAVLFFAPRPFAGTTGFLVLGLAVASQGLTTSMHHEMDNIVFTHASFLLAACFWLLTVHSARGRTVAAPQESVGERHQAAA
jgi:hypothetical protein